MRVVLGIDTSSYTSSVCLVAEDGAILAEPRKLLSVPSGSRGLRQSEALFQHVRNLPELTRGLKPQLQGRSLAAIGVSARPRPQVGSYLPVFLPGLTMAQTLSHLLDLPCHELSHQENHIWAGLGSAKGPKTNEFLAIHLSGGATELVAVQRRQGRGGLDLTLLGNSTDLYAGQFVDRLGVKLGLPFPAGPALEELAATTKHSVPVASFHRRGEISFSGPLTALENMLGAVAPEILARTCLKVVARTLIKWIKWAGEQSDARDLLIVGGVAANKLLRSELRRELPGWQFYFAEPAHSVDNAYGAAYYAGLMEGFWGGELL